MSRLPRALITSISRRIINKHKMRKNRHVPIMFFLLASMGYGKTTAVKTFLSSKKNLRYVWFSLSTGESDELWMWQKFCQSFEDINPELSKRFAGYGLPQAAVDLERILGVVKKTVTERTVIVIDDYHENKSGHMNRLITYIARGCVSNLHIVLISRSIPEIPIDELALKGLCMELSQDKFEFTREETLNMNGDVPEFAHAHKIVNY